MPIEVACTCGKSLTARDYHAGKRARCPGCGRALTIPGTPASAYDVFISHSKHDQAIAQAICARLESQGISCWLAPRNITPGKVWGEAIIEGINQCRVLVLVHSAQSNESHQVIREIERADDKGLVLVPFRIEDVPFSAAMEYFLSNHQWLDAVNPPLDAHLETLARTLDSLLSGRPETAPLRVATATPPLAVAIEAEPFAPKRALGARFGSLLGPRTVWIASVALGAIVVASTGAFVYWRAVQARAGMVFIPAGKAHLGASEARLRAHARTLGSLRSDPELVERFVELCQDEPHEEIHVDGFWIDGYEVTNSQYARFLEATKRSGPSHWPGGRSPAGKDDHPVAQIRHSDAAAYAAWIGKNLPTVAQWTRAFRGDDDRMYPWGDTWYSDRANVVENETFPTGTSPVQASPLDVSPFGVFNLAGNVSEFLRETTVRNGKTSAITKGGESEASGPIYGAAPFRYYLVGKDMVHELTGFRCVLERGR